MNTSSFLRFTAFCAFFAVITTILNTQLHHFYPAPASFDERVALVNNGWYMFRQFVLLAHPFGTLMLAIGLGIWLLPKQKGLAITGIVFVFMEKLVEFWGQTIQLFTVNLNWKTAYLASTDAAAKSQLKLFMMLFSDVWNDCFFVLWTSYILASLAFGFALWKERETSILAFWTSLLLFITALMTLIMLLSDYGKQAWLQPVLPIFYPLTMILSRILIGIFLWKSVQTLTSQE